MLKTFLRHDSLRWLLFVVAAYSLLILSTTAEAAVIGVLKSTETPDTVRVTDEDAPYCANGSKSAVYVVGNSDKARAAGKVGLEIKGCWGVVSGKIHMEFEDGDVFSMPHDKIEWVAGKRPAKFWL